MLFVLLHTATALATIVDAFKNNNQLTELDLSGNLRYLCPGNFSVIAKFYKIKLRPGKLGQGFYFQTEEHSKLF